MKHTLLFGQFLFYLALITGLFLVVTFIWTAAPVNTDATAGLLVLAGTVTAIGILSVVFHELGHSAAAWIVGFRLVAFVVGPVQLIRIEGQYRWRWRVKSDMPFSGYVLATPQSSTHLSARQAVAILGGPCFSLLLALASGLVFLLFSENGRWIYLASGLSFLINAVAVLQTLIPMVCQGNPCNDGGLLLLLHKNPRSMRDYLSHGNLWLGHHLGIRPKQWNRDDILLSLEAPSSGDASDFMVYVMGYYHFLDSGLIDEAEKQLANMVQFQEAHRAEIKTSAHLESVYFKALFRNDTANARETLNKSQESPDEAQYARTRLRAEAALLLAEGKTDQAIQKAEAALQLLKQLDGQGDAIAEIGWLNTIIAKCK